MPGSASYIGRCKMYYTFWCRGKESPPGPQHYPTPAGGKEGDLGAAGGSSGHGPVRIRYVTRRTEFAGMWGTIENSFGSTDHPALDVRLENGRLELFWFYQLDRAG